jgi:hypothetical protein
MTQGFLWRGDERLSSITKGNFLNSWTTIGCPRSRSSKVYRPPEVLRAISDCSWEVQEERSASASDTQTSQQLWQKRVTYIDGETMTLVLQIGILDVSSRSDVSFRSLRANKMTASPERTNKGVYVCATQNCYPKDGSDSPSRIRELKLLKRESSYCAYWLVNRAHFFFFCDSVVPSWSWRLSIVDKNLLSLGHQRNTYMRQKLDVTHTVCEVEKCHKNWLQTRRERIQTERNGRQAGRKEGKAGDTNCT